MLARRLGILAAVAVVLTAGSASAGQKGQPPPRVHHVKRFSALRLTGFHFRLHVRPVHARIVRVRVLDEMDQITDQRCGVAVLTTTAGAGELVDLASAGSRIEFYRSRPPASFAGRGPPPHA